ncbi:uncharacterized protein [Drosophila kikkawai]|uniref:Reverse transcriptase domain-containing protein n=1 Tax=Drosophila kikkawai TaxID=30033 RepID=A0ABM3C4N7_DROKI|nr:uncharacterized protein LOC121502046 [Drosophila kikkawai]
MVKFLQLNLNHCRAAQVLLSQTATELKTDVAILSEPYRAKPDGVWQQSTDGGAAIWSCGQPAGHMTQRASRPGYTRAKIHEVTVYSCYLAPSMHIDAFRDVVQEIAQDARGRSSVLIAGDFTAWGSSRTTQRGTILLDALATLNVCLLNDGNRCTYSKAGRESVIDLTFASPELTRNSQWEVTDLLTYSDHAAITFKTMHSQQRLPDRQTAYRLCGWVICQDQGCLRCGNGELQQGMWQATSPVVEPGDSHSPKRERNRGRPLQGMYESIYRETKKALKVAIKPSKNRCFQDLCDAADQEPFGSAYKMVMGKLIRQPTPTSHEQLGAIVTTLFPAQPPLVLPNVTVGEPIPIDEEEVLSALTSCKASKAPGPDGIPNAALLAIVKSHPKLFAEVYNNCIAERTFPTGWKQQRLVLVPKPGKLDDDPSSYRPLCMLNSLGKIFERIICSRLEAEIEERGALSSHQHGFRKKRSTIDAIREVTQLAENAIEGERWQGGTKKYCLVCTLDVKNAFNSANWSRVLQALQRGGISG